MSSQRRSFLPGLTIRTKLILLVVVLAVIATVLAVFLIRDQRAGTEQARRELAGVDHLRKVKILLEDLAEHRSILGAELLGAPADSEARVRLAEAVATDLDSLSTPPLGGAEELATIERNWEALENRALSLTPEQSRAAHGRLIEDVLAYAVATGEASGLRTTPDVAPLYLIDALLGPVLVTVSDIGEAEGTSLRGAEDRGDPSSLGTGLIEAAAGLEERVGASERSLELAFAQGRGLRQDIEPSLVAVRRQVQQFVESLRTVAGVLISTEETEELEGTEDPPLALQPARLAAEASRARTSLFGLATAILDDTDRLISERRSRLQRQFIIVVASVLASLLIGSLLGFLIIRGMSRQMRSFQETFARIGIGDFRARVEAHGRDELGQLAVNLNAMLDNTLNLIQTADDRDQMQGSIRKLLDEVSGVAQGDLTRRAEVTPEMTGAIADSFNFMIDQLQTIIRDVQDTTDAVGGSARRIQSAAVELAQGSGDQAEKVYSASAAIDQMASAVQRVSANADDAGRVAEEALDNARRGRKAVSDTIEGMDGIRSQVQTTAKRVKLLGESSQEIGEIIQLMGDIADRTSVLALNASIQAAAAGEAGKGFAVVAEEVERLAERSVGSSKRIEGLIKSIQSETHEVLSAMEETTTQVVGGSHLANRAGVALTEIEQVSTRLSELFASITDTSREQAQQSQSVTEAMGDISHITEKTSSGTREVAESIRHLALLADRLRESVSAFRLPERSASSSEADAPSPAATATQA